MKKILFIFLIFFASSLNAQEKSNYKKVAEKFQSFYNSGDYESIFNLFDQNMKKAMPLEKANTFFSQNMKADLGLIKKMEFYKYKQTAHIYKTTFDNAVFDVLISLDAKNAINELYVSPHAFDNLPKLERNITKMILPFQEEWTVFWGGTTVEDNYHVAYKNQKGAYDLGIEKNGKSYKGNPKKNSNYFVFGKKVIAICDASVVKVIFGVKDNVPGKLNPNQLTGNTVILKTKANEYILYAHLKEHSITVKEGQQIKQGDVLGLCGNSGNSSEPHLHLSLQNVKNMNIATGAKLYFSNIKVNGIVKKRVHSYKKR